MKKVKASGIVAELKSLPKCLDGKHLKYRLTPEQQKELDDASAAWKAMPVNDRPSRKHVKELLSKYGISLCRTTIAEKFPHDAHG